MEIKNGGIKLQITTKKPSLDAQKYFQQTKKELSKIENLLYQYRPCRRDESTIYDIENIRHNVAYAQTPLNMNDPFDSRIGFSTEKIYDELISLVLDSLNLEETIKQVLWYLLKFQLLDKFAEFISALNEIKRAAKFQRKAMHKESLPFKTFLSSYLTQIFNKLPKNIKALFNKDSFKIFGAIISSMEDIEITEENIKSFTGVGDQLETFKQTIIDIKNEIYIPSFNKFLSLLTISCFSASGWKNTLMWSHYANSYAGFCVEYDFERMTDFLGFVKKIQYSKIRPTISLKDMGIDGLQYVEDEEGIKSTEIISSEPDLEKIINYLTVKDTCWDYEEEWRIINIGKDPYTPHFIEMPDIKSITFGVNIDYLCKQLLWDVCQEKTIPCYELVLGEDNFSIERKQLSQSDFVFNLEKELKYVSLICETYEKNIEKMGIKVSKVTEMVNNKNFDASLVIDVDKCVIDCLTDSYFMKSSIIRIFDKYDNIENEEIPGELIFGAQQLDNYINESKKMIENQKETLVKIALENLISPQDYTMLLKLVFKIDSLLEKVENLEWPKLLIEKRN